MPEASARIPAVIGIDLGTTEAKAAAIGIDGRLHGLGRAGYPIDVRPDGRAEQWPGDWWAAVAAAVRAIDVSGLEVLAICGVGQGPTLAVVDEAGAPIRPAITWQDRRPGDAGFGLLPRIAWLRASAPCPPPTTLAAPFRSTRMSRPGNVPTITETTARTPPPGCRCPWKRG